MDEKKIKHCENCNKTFTSNAHYLIHCETELHKTGKRKVRANKKEEFKCSICKIYTTKQPTNMKLHILNNHSSIEEKKKNINIIVNCDIGYLVEQKINTHLNTLKNKINKN